MKTEIPFTTTVLRLAIRGTLEGNTGLLVSGSHHVGGNGEFPTIYGWSGEHCILVEFGFKKSWGKLRKRLRRSSINRKSPKLVSNNPRKSLENTPSHVTYKSSLSINYAESLELLCEATIPFCASRSLVWASHQGRAWQSRQWEIPNNRTCDAQHSHWHY